MANGSFPGWLTVSITAHLNHTSLFSLFMTLVPHMQIEENWEKKQAFQ